MISNFDFFGGGSMEWAELCLESPRMHVPMSLSCGGSSDGQTKQNSGHSPHVLWIRVRLWGGQGSPHPLLQSRAQRASPEPGWTHLHTSREHQGSPRPFPAAPIAQDVCIYICISWCCSGSAPSSSSLYCWSRYGFHSTGSWHGAMGELNITAAARTVHTQFLLLQVLLQTDSHT